MCCSTANRVQSSKYRVLTYQNARFDAPRLKDVVLIIDGVRHPLGTYTNPTIMRNAFVAQLIALGHTTGVATDPIGDVAQVSVDFNGIDYSITFTCTQGFQTRLELEIENVLLIPTVPDIGAFVEFVTLSDGLLFSDVSSFSMQFGTIPQVAGIDSNYSFVSQLLGTTFDNTNATSNNYEFEGNSSAYVKNFLADYTNVTALKTAIDSVLIDFNIINGHPSASTPYMASLSNADINDVPLISVYCTETLKVENQNTAIPTFYNSSRKTGFEGNIKLIVVDFVQLNLIGNEPIVELQYLLNGEAKAQLFTYDSITLSYIN
jgi:hypothetical protein